jgi:sugar phosphate isomerase/epimerase
MRSRGLVLWSLSATSNAVHPDLERRHRDTARARGLIGRCAGLGTRILTVCTGTRDPEDCWRWHVANRDVDAWRDLRRTLDSLLPHAEAAGVTLAIEPEPANVVADARLARRLLDELGSASAGITLDPANLVAGRPPAEHEGILGEALELLGSRIVCSHAKDVLGGRFVAPGRGDLDYHLVFRLLEQAHITAPVILQDVGEADVPRARQYVSHCRERALAHAARRP